MNTGRRRLSVVVGIVVAAVTFACGMRVSAIAGPMHWTKQPRVTVVSAADDPRIPLVREAVDLWNRTFAELGTPFRFGDITVVSHAVPDAELKAMCGQVGRRSWRPPLPPSTDALPGDLVVVLSSASFISCAAGRDDRAVVAIKNPGEWPLTLPNVLRNVIAHEIGHAIGLQHNDDRTLLMCGRPAPCRPDAFQSTSPRFFPLSVAERAQLQRVYR